MNGVFLDSSGIIACWNHRDQWHAAAVAAFRGIPLGTTLVTSRGICLLACEQARVTLQP